jgi:predicted P-loop ATPase
MARGPRVVPFAQPPAWTGLLRRNGNGSVYPDVANVLIALRNEQNISEAFAFDEMQQETMVQKALPIAPGGVAGEAPPKRLADDDTTRVQEWLQHSGMPKVGREIVGQAIEARARERRFHPIRDYLQGVVWDGKPRLNTWLKTYMGAEGSDNYLAAIGAMFIIAMVARVMDPGCKCDYMLVLEGEQGVMKSLACKALAGEDYFSDDLGDMANKDAKQHVIGKWLVEESELANFTRASTETLKSFLSRTHEKFRPPYGKNQIIAPRQNVFVGTTNRGDYNKDETGGRRLWPVRVVTRIDIEGIKRDRDQIFAEGVDRYRAGENWWPDPEFEAEIIKPEQHERRSIDAWQQPIADWLAQRRHEKISVMEVAFGALFMERAKLGTADQNRIKVCMSLEQWKKEDKRSETGYFWRYVGSL